MTKDEQAERDRRVGAAVRELVAAYGHTIESALASSRVQDAIAAALREEAGR